MSDATDDAPARALELSGKLREVIADTSRDLGRMPFFVRPMFKRGLAKRTGKSLDEWIFVSGELLARFRRGGTDATRASIVTRFPSLLDELDKLAEHYRTAPDRAKRGMGSDPKALEEVRTKSAHRQEVVSELRAALDALPE